MNSTLKIQKQNTKKSQNLSNYNLRSKALKNKEKSPRTTRPKRAVTVLKGLVLNKNQRLINNDNNNNSSNVSRISSVSNLNSMISESSRILVNNNNGSGTNDNLNTNDNNRLSASFYNEFKLSCTII